MGLRPTLGGLLLLRSLWGPRASRPLCTLLSLPPAFCPWRGWGAALGLERVGVGWGLAITISCPFQNEDASEGSELTVC